MGTPRDPRPAKYFVGLLSADIELLNSVETDLAAIFGAIDARSETLPWNLSRFYEKEMGAACSGASSLFSIGFAGNLAEIKLKTQQVEEKYRWAGRAKGEKSEH